MSRYVLALLLLAVVGPLAIANVMIIRVVIQSGPADAVQPPDAPPPVVDPGAPEGTLTPPPVAEAAPPIGDPARSIVVMVPILGKHDEKREFDITKSRKADLNPEWPVIRHKFGITFLYTDGSTVYLHPVAQPPRQQQVWDLYRAWEAKKQGPAELHEIALEALAAGMTKEAEEYCDKLLSLTKGKTSGLSPELQRFAKAYGELAPKLKSPSAQPADTDHWKDQLLTLSGNGMPANVQKHMHYALIYWDVSDDEVTRRLQQLEENFKNFYLWHALRGESPKIPEKPLPVILAPQVKDVSNLFRALDGRSISTEGFFAPEHGVLVLSPGRLDPLGQAFQRMMDSVYKSTRTASQEDLVKGKGPAITKDMRPETVARLTTLALVERMLREDSETAAISREGSRQILYAIKALPQYVPLPRWLESGYGSVYERARVPIYNGRDTEQPSMTFAINRGTGAPHFAMLKFYREFLQSGELDTDPASRLKKVLNDEYFAAARAGVDLDPRRGDKPMEPDPKIDPAHAKAMLTEKLMKKAHSTSWALVYFLAHARPAELLKFGEELDRLPHDLPLDPTSLRLAFGRAFKMLKDDGQTFDPAALESLGKSWDDFMSTVQQPTFDVPITRPKMSMPGDPTRPDTPAAPVP